MMFSMSETFDDRGTPDVVWGAKAIADQLGLTPRQVHYMADKGDLPIGRLRGKLFAIRSELMAYLSELASKPTGGRA